MESQMPQILCWDGKNAFSEALLEQLKIKGLVVTCVPVDELLAKVVKGEYDGVVLNFSEEPTPIESALIQELKEIDDQIPIFVLAPQASVATAVEFMKQGIADFLILPAGAETLGDRLLHQAHRYRLTRRVYQMEPMLQPVGNFMGIVGQSESMLQLFETIETVAKTKATVLILGESGVGKELVAAAIHHLSTRNTHRFIDINCGAIPHELLENELFGHERGAYTGAERRYIGSFERAQGGTLFLDEICEMDLALQAKILRVLQEKHFFRVGGNEEVEVDVRVIAATNRNIEQEVKAGRFREDLYYRLNVIPMTVAPLRERRADIPLLAKHFLIRYAREQEKIMHEIHHEAIEALVSYDWPGNVRELENTIQRVVALYNDSTVKLKHLPLEIRKKRKVIEIKSSETKISPLEEVEKAAIAEALRHLEGNMVMAAKLLNIGQATLYRKVRKYGIER